MLPLRDVVARIIRLREQGRAQMTLLGVCPNSSAVLEAAVMVAAGNHAPMLLAATLNQVDRDGGYTGWTPAGFVRELEAHAARYACRAPLYPCLDHGGPWLKDRHATDRLSLADTMAEVKATLTACLEAGYSLLHLDPTVDRELPPGRTIAIETVLERTVELVAHCEAERRRLGLDAVSYEVGTEEVHGGLVDLGNFCDFVQGLRRRLCDEGLEQAWPCFIVGKVGTDLGNPAFDPEAARRLYEIVAPLGSLVKGHYTDWVENPGAYPVSGMGGANVGPEFTSEEYLALEELAAREADMLRGRPRRRASGIMQALEQAVRESGRWQKWLRAEEQGRDLSQLPSERRSWLVQTGARYVWTDARVREARERLYDNLSAAMPDPHRFVVGRVAASMERYVTHFHLFDAQALLEEA
ncbi:MAG: class II D-tagatose-bisphosphate aldolase, non-catalytic subunit [Anaerolineae bacterium]|nr:class II D-tagatose-bisphosphate aldolase, non-catalytic subunit [Anaerolineae bacterium]